MYLFLGTLRPKTRIFERKLNVSVTWEIERLGPWVLDLKEFQTVAIRGHWCSGCIFHIGGMGSIAIIANPSISPIADDSGQIFQVLVPVQPSFGISGARKSFFHGHAGMGEDELCVQWEEAGDDEQDIEGHLSKEGVRC